MLNKTLKKKVSPVFFTGDHVCYLEGKSCTYSCLEPQRYGAENLVQKNTGDYSTFSVSAEGYNFLQEKQTIFLPEVMKEFWASGNSSFSRNSDYCVEVFEALRELRMNLAQ